MRLFRRGSGSAGAHSAPTVGQRFIGRGNLTPTIYGECLDASPRYVSAGIIYARCYSKLCPEGEYGSFPVTKIERILSDEEFERGRLAGWKH